MRVDVRQVLERFEDYRSLAPEVRDALVAALDRKLPIDEQILENEARGLIALWMDPPTYQLTKDEIRRTLSAEEESRAPKYLVKQVIADLNLHSGERVMPEYLMIRPAIDLQTHVLGAFYEAAMRGGKTVTGFVPYLTPSAFHPSYDEFAKARDSVK